MNNSTAETKLALKTIVGLTDVSRDAYEKGLNSGVVVKGVSKVLDCVKFANKECPYLFCGYEKDTKPFIEILSTGVFVYSSRDIVLTTINTVKRCFKSFKFTSINLKENFNDNATLKP